MDARSTLLRSSRFLTKDKVYLYANSGLHILHVIWELRRQILSYVEILHLGTIIDVFSGPLFLGWRVNVSKWRGCFFAMISQLQRIYQNWSLVKTYFLSKSPWKVKISNLSLQTAFKFDLSKKENSAEGTAKTRDGAEWQGDINCSSLPAGLGRNG